MQGLGLEESVVSEQLIAVHQAHAKTTQYSDVICSNEGFCDWCRDYSDVHDIDPMDEKCYCSVRKCTTCGILCGASASRCIVMTCTCSKNKRETYQWLCMESMDSCNIHVAKAVPAVSVVTTVSVVPVVSKHSNVVAIHFATAPDPSERVRKHKLTPYSHLRKYIPLLIRAVLAPNDKAQHEPRAHHEPETNLESVVDPKPQSAVPGSEFVPELAPGHKCETGHEPTNDLSTGAIIHSWIRNLGSIAPAKRGCAACEAEDLDQEHRHEVSLCSCGRVYSGECVWGVWTNSCTCDPRDIRWFDPSDKRCNHHP